jgi:hypothetical protein
VEKHTHIKQNRQHEVVVALQSSQQLNPLNLNAFWWIGVNLEFRPILFTRACFRSLRPFIIVIIVIIITTTTHLRYRRADLIRVKN